MSDTQKPPSSSSSNEPSPFAFEVRFGGAAIECGVVPIPRVVIDHYAALGISDAEMMWVVHILAFKWTADNPYPKRGTLLCKANNKTQQRYAAKLRGLGLLFTTRRWRDGRVVSLVYDFDSLLHNCVSLHNEIERRASEYMVEYHAHVGPDHTDHRRAYRAARVLVTRGAVAQFEIALDAETEQRLRAGEYDYVPAPWSALEPEKGDKSQEPAPPGDALDNVFGPKRLPMDLSSKPNSRSNRPSTIPVQAGGGDGPAEAVVDGIMRWNGTPGIDAMPPKERTGWVRLLAEVITKWGGATREQASLAWQAWMIQVGWPQPVNPFVKSWPASFGPQLLGVRTGTITAETLRQVEVEKANQDNGGSDALRRKPPAEDIDPEMREKQRAALAELRTRQARRRQVPTETDMPDPPVPDKTLPPPN